MTPRPLRYTLVTDGSSDACLRFPIEWCLRAMGWFEIEGQWADWRVIPDRGVGLAGRLVAAIGHYPAELYFVHRDAEREPVEHRLSEIRDALEWSKVGKHVCIVPVRMTEAWLLHDEGAVRTSAGRPRGTVPLDLPPPSRVEQVPDPKTVLRDALLAASEARGRRRKQKLRDFGAMRFRVAELIRDYAPLRALSAFSRFEDELRVVLESL